jgi:hypothetical protein
LIGPRNLGFCLFRQPIAEAMLLGAAEKSPAAKLSKMFPLLKPNKPGLPLAIALSVTGPNLYNSVYLYLERGAVRLNCHDIVDVNDKSGCASKC